MPTSTTYQPERCIVAPGDWFVSNRTDPTRQAVAKGINGLVLYFGTRSGAQELADARNEAMDAAKARRQHAMARR